MKTAWFLSHRIREAMKDDMLGPLGGEGQTVEADETFIGGKEKNRHRSKRATSRLGGSWGKETVFSLVERDGRVRSMHVASVTAANLRPILVGQIDGPPSSAPTMLASIATWAAISGMKSSTTAPRNMCAARSIRIRSKASSRS